uniref:Uncharacterized protein n=1 Tax=Hordeum vulgare subsp. vulgare TaxID=112509 RepID=A0A8I6YL44_HORVV
MVLYGSSYTLCSISRKGNSCIKRQFFFEKEMEMLPYQFLAILYLFLDSDAKNPYKPISKLLLRFYGIPFKCTKKSLVGKESNAGEFISHRYSNEKIRYDSPRYSPHRILIKSSILYWIGASY